MIKLEPLTGHHDRSRFDCGIAALNQWLKQTALQHHTKGISRTFVAVPADGQTDARHAVLAFYALSAAFVVNEELPSPIARRYPRQIPVSRLGRLAVGSAIQGMGLGRLLLVDAILRARAAAQSVGSAGIFVDAKDENIAAFYRKFGFTNCADSPLKLFLPMAALS